MQTYTPTATRRRFLATLGASAVLPLTTLAPKAEAAPPWWEWFWPPRPTPAPEPQDNAVHTLRRISFGPRPTEITRFRSLGIEDYLEEQLNWQSIDDSSTDTHLQTYYPSVMMGDCELFAYNQKLAAQNLGAARLYRAIYSKRQLYELMVGFWSDHFNIQQEKVSVLRILKTKDENEVIRPHALGKFRDMLAASMRSPAMLVYLDNWRNLAWGPNENYARELMELHTLGVDGGYTEDDIKEVARCLSGWSMSVGQDGWPCAATSSGFVFYPELHDPGEKLVLGTPIPNGGIEDGNRVMELLMANPATARHIARKLCRFLVGETVSTDLINATATAFGIDGDIPAMLRTIILSPEFLEPADEIYRRPFEYGVACMRSMDIADNEIGIYQVASLLMGTGHMPYTWADPDGFPLDRDYWLNTNGHLMRWNMAIGMAAANGADGQPMAIRLAGDATSTNDIVKHLSQAILHKELDYEQQTALVTFAAAGLHPDTPLAGFHRNLAVIYITGLLLSSADFQLY